MILGAINPIDWTLAVIGLFPAGLIVWLFYDVLVELYLKPKFGVPTITHEVITISKAYPIIPALSSLILGLLIAHFWGQF